MNKPDKKPISEYEVGFKKPPTKTRFQKGHSGNPGGRPRGSVNWQTELCRALKEQVTVIENGKRKSVSKIRAAMTQVANKAAGGDLKAVKLVTDLQPLIENDEKYPGAPRMSIVEVVYAPLPEKNPIDLKTIAPDEEQ